MTDHRLERTLSRFPWRRRKPRTTQTGLSPVPLTTKDGQQMWADPYLLATFEDPAPALLYVAVSKNQAAHRVVRVLVRHHAARGDRELPEGSAEETRAGLDVLAELFETAGLDPEDQIGSHTLSDLIGATWAVAVGAEPPP